MGNVNYQLPEQLGTLSFSVPAHWVGARADGVEALWIEQRTQGFKDNVTLRFFSFDRVTEPEKLLDSFISKLLSDSDQTTETDVLTASGKRMVSFDSQIDDHLLRQHELVIHADSPSKSYLILLSNTHERANDPVDLSSAEIVTAR